MFFQPVDLTTALRPSLLPDETLLFVQDAVGLYEGKFKIPHMQNGHAYLTSHRACYVDNVEPRKHSIAVELKSIEKYEFYAGFLRSSPKISLYPKGAKGGAVPSRSQSAVSTPQLSAHLRRGDSPSSRGSSAFDASSQRSSSPSPSTFTWICQICSQPNHVPPHFDATTANVHTPLVPCSTCGVKPSLAHILKAAINSASGRPTATHRDVPSQPLLESHQQSQGSLGGSPTPLAAKPSSAELSCQCPRCTFLNHPSLPNCELCGASLVSVDFTGHKRFEKETQRPESPGPVMDSSIPDLDHSLECVKFSFRGGGDKVFHERLKGAMLQRKWLLQNAPPVPRPSRISGGTPDRVLTPNGQLEGTTPLERSKIVGIAGLERRGLELRKNNEMVLGNAFEDLEALMASAKEIVALAETFANKASEGGTEAANALLQESATALGMVTTKDMLTSRAGSETLYISELSRNLAEYLTDDAKGILQKEGGIMSLVDLWAVFNRARGGVELISPMDFEKAARSWERLKLPVRLRQFKNGLLVVQRYDWTDDKTIAQLLSWLQELHVLPPPGEAHWDWEAFGRGITAQEAAQKFGWSIGVATEELEMAEENGVLCREESVEGLRYWENWIVEEGDVASFAPAVDPETLAVTRNLVDLGLW